jgi:hypothetical protein
LPQISLALPRGFVSRWRFVAATRKLFLTHAGELAHRLVRDVGRDGLVARFVRSYAERHGRHGLLSDPERLPELSSTIGREALLVMAADVHRLLPQAFLPGPKGVLRPDDAAFIEAFYAEFLASLSRAVDWLSAVAFGEAPSEKEMFRRDLEMYRRWGQRPASAASAEHAGESPFRDRCALLLDPAMMEQARRSAAEFEAEILRMAAQRFRQLGRTRDFTTRAPRRRSTKAARGDRAKTSGRRAPRHSSAKRKRSSHPLKPARHKKRKPTGRRKPSRG